MNALDTLKAIAPTLANGRTDEELNIFLGLAVGRMNACVWGSLFTQGVAYLAAHLLHLSAVRAAAAATGAAGPLTMQMAGRVQLSYGQPRDWDKNGLQLSPWGQEFDALTRKLAGRKMFNVGFRLEDMCNPNPQQMGEDG